MAKMISKEEFIALVQEKYGTDWFKMHMVQKLTDPKTFATVGWSYEHFNQFTGSPNVAETMYYFDGKLIFGKHTNYFDARNDWHHFELHNADGAVVAWSKNKNQQHYSPETAIACLRNGPQKEYEYNDHAIADMIMQLLG